VCVVDAQHFLGARRKYPELDKQAALAERIVLSKTDLADPAPVLAFLQDLNPGAELFTESPAVAALFPFENEHRARTALGALGPIRPHGRESGIRAYSFRPAAPVTWAGWSAWSRLVAAEFSDRLIRVKGLLKMEESGEIAFVQGVQGVFHPPQRLREWPDADHGNRLVCIARDLRQAQIEVTLAALNTAPGTQAIYSLRDLQERQAQQ
jgi:G3E family GTPase